MIMDDRTTFWKLLNDVEKIDIPQIQRDYAQGRVEEAERREKFLEAIYGHLRDGKPLHLDFIYGKIEKNFFYLIDGQQRLTTLFLLHWYFGAKEEKFDELEKLKKFSYDTRPSSRDFCIALVDNAKKISKAFENKKEEEIISDFIKDFSWFKYGWEDDPTISSMLVMIDSIHNKFNDFQDGWSKLVDSGLVTFEVLDLGKEGFELPDELYIKMNARGKQLTSFENFKAEFIDFLFKEYTEQEVLYYEVLGKKILYGDYFAYKIEKEWCDLFWEYKGDLSTSKSPIDEKIMNFIYVIAQLCYFKDNLEKNAEDFKCNFEAIKEVFGKKDNIDFLFFVLDCLYSKSLDSSGKVSKNVLENFFSAVFFVNRKQNERYDSVNIAWNLESESLFSQCINKGLKLDARNKILLYCMFSFLKNRSEGNLNFYLRVIRNLLYARRQLNETKYNTNVRINDFGKYWKLFEQLQADNVYDLLASDSALDNERNDISEQSLEHEKQKAKLLTEENRKSLFALEDQSFLCGYLRNFGLQNNADKINEYATAVNEVFNCQNTSLVIRAMISSGFGGIYIRDCAIGCNYYFGCDWETVLTGDVKNNELVIFLDNYILRKENSAEEKLQGMIDDWLKDNATDRTWQYYFIKYEEFTNKQPSNYYCWPSDFKIEILGSESGNPLCAYHINPFVYTVCKRMDDSEICSENDCYARYAYESYLYLKNKKCFICRDDGWKIDNLGGIPKNILEKYKDDKKDNLLKPNEKMDMIEIVVAFLKDLYK